jgi:SAM-dependent methyltransferase
VEIRTADDVLELLDASVASAAVGAAVELGLFWLLADEPLGFAEVGERLGIPAARARVWLQLLEGAGLIEPTDSGYRPSSEAREAILAAYSRGTWALLAEEARERRDGLSDLPRRLREPGPAVPTPSYVVRMAADPDRARRFTRMLYELHQPLADLVADSIDLGDAGRLLDLGGGSGVVSITLARRFPRLKITVADIPTVCAAGRDIAEENGLGFRITYQPVDLLHDDLPRGFDAVLECDVGLYDEALFGRVRAALRPGGRFVVVDQLAPDDDHPPAHLEWALEGALRDPGFAAPTVASVADLMRAAGFEDVLHRLLPAMGGPGDRFAERMTLIEARAPVAADA